MKNVLFFPFSKLRNLPLFFLFVFDLSSGSTHSVFSIAYHRFSFSILFWYLFFFCCCIPRTHVNRCVGRISNLEFARVVAVGLRKHGTFFINASLTLILLETFVFIAIFESFSWKEVLSHFSFRFISWRTNDQNEMTSSSRSKSPRFYFQFWCLFSPKKYSNGKPKHNFGHKNTSPNARIWMLTLQCVAYQSIT